MSATGFRGELEKLGGVQPVGSDELLPLTEDEIAELEQLAGSAFPADYRRFLSEAGGLVFEEDLRFPTLDPLPEDFSRSGLAVMGSFFGSSHAKAHQAASLRWNVEQSPDSYPDNLIAIGDDGAGGKILLDLNPSTLGTVWYYPQMNDWFQSDREEPFRVAGSFEELIQSLRPAAG